VLVGIAFLLSVLAFFIDMTGRTGMVALGAHLYWIPSGDFHVNIAFWWTS